MKKYLLPFVAVVVLASCGENADQRAIRAVAQPYLEATSNYCSQQAMPYATPETQQSLQFIERAIMPLVDTAYILSNQPATITINQIELLSDTAAVVHYHKQTPIQETDSELGMRKRNAEWKVYMPLKQEFGEK